MLLCPCVAGGGGGLGDVGGGVGGEGGGLGGVGGGAWGGGGEVDPGLPSAGLLTGGVGPPLAAQGKDRRQVGQIQDDEYCLIDFN